MTDSNTTKAITVTILDKEYLVACPEEERHELARSADYLDRKMREIRDGGKVIGADRIAVMAALNISHELIYPESTGNQFHESLTGRIKGMQEKIEQALYKHKNQPLEL